MNGKVKAGVIVCALVALFSTVFYVGFQTGYYRREAELSIDVGTTSLHCHWLIEYADGRVEEQYHAGVLTTIGKNWIEDQLGDSPATDPAKWISLSTSSNSPATGWTQIPTEITGNGLHRQAGTYSSTGDGVWTIEKQFTANATNTNVQLTGLQWASSGDNNLLGADTFTPVTLNDGDKITVTWTVTVS